MNAARGLVVQYENGGTNAPGKNAIVSRVDRASVETVPQNPGLLSPCKKIPALAHQENGRVNIGMKRVPGGAGTALTHNVCPLASLSAHRFTHE